MANLEIAGSHKRTQKGSVDYYYGGDNEAWADLAAAKAGVPSSIRPGKTVGIYVSGEIVEYWWPDATNIADADLVIKQFTLPQPLDTTDSPTFDSLDVTNALTAHDAEIQNLQVDAGLKIGNGGPFYAFLGTTPFTGTRSITIQDKSHTVAGLDDIAAAVSAGNHFRGKYASVSALTTAIPSGNDGDYAIVTGAVSDQEYIWDSDHTSWVLTTNIPASTFGALGGSPSDNTALAAALGAKVDKVTGYDLLSSADQTKLNGIAAGATANSAAAQSDVTTGTDNVKFLTSSLWAWIKTQVQTISGIWNFSNGLQSGGSNVETQNNKATDFTTIDNNKYPTTAAVRADRLVSFNDQTGTAYTLVLTDQNKKVRISNAAANTVMIPTNASVAFPVGSTIRVQMAGTGNTSIVGASGVTVHGYTQVIDVQYNEALLFKEATDTWSVIGIAPDVSAIDGTNASIKKVSGSNEIDFKTQILQAAGLGGCLSFNAASSQYVDLPTTNFSGSNVDFTVAIVLKTTQTTGGFFKLAAASGHCVWGGFTSGSTEFGQNGGTSYVGAKTINDGNWHLWIVTYTASSQTLTAYVDNSLLNSGGAGSNVIMNSDVVRLGTGAYAGNTFQFTGQIAQCLIYNAVLGSTDRSAIWNSGNFTSSPPTTNLLRSYQFQDASGTSLADSNPNTTQYAGTLNNGPTWQGPGNGAIAQGSTTTTMTYKKIVDGAISGERGQAYHGDVLCGNIIQGRSIKHFINNFYSFIQDFTGKVLINPSNTNTNATAASTLDIAGNQTIGASYAGTNAAPANGLLVQGRTLIGTTTDNLTDQMQISGNLNLVTAGNKLKIATGTNASIGTATLVAGTVTVSTTAVTASSKIFVCVRTPGGTQGFLSVPTSSVTAGTSFVINSSSSSEISTVDWWIIN